MAPIATYVFFDIETTGLPCQEWNQTKIIEASFIAALQKDIESTDLDSIPPVSKLTFMLNPQRPISKFSVQLTGLSNALLKHAPVFKQKFASLSSFLNDLPAPVCLVAHNGNSFDFKILLAECGDARVVLPESLLCLDSLVGFRRLLKGTNICYKTLKQAPMEDNSFCDDLLTDDEESSSQSDDELMVEYRKEQRNFIIKKTLKEKCKKESFKLNELYKRLLNKEEENAHRAEVDCLMLLKCVVALKEQFIPWSYENCQLLSEIKPLMRRYH